MHAVVAILLVLFNNGLVIWGLGWDGWSGPTSTDNDLHRGQYARPSSSGSRTKALFMVDPTEV